MKAHDLARLLLAGENVEVKVVVDDWIYRVDKANIETTDMYEDHGNIVLIDLFDGEVIS